MRLGIRILVSSIVIVACGGAEQGVGPPPIPTSCPGTLEAPSEVGQHAVLATAGTLGCPIHLTSGTYGVAAYSIASAGTDLGSSGMRAYEVSLSSAATANHLGRLELHSVATFDVRPIDIPAANSRASLDCQHATLSAGEQVQLNNDGYVAARLTERSSTYDVVSVSAHFAIAIRHDDEASVTQAQLASARQAAPLLESAILPFLLRSFTTLPDVDSNTQTLIALATLDKGIDGEYLPNSVGYADGCVGDVVYLDTSTLSRTDVTATEPPSFQSTVLHELTHRIDDYNASLSSKASWSIEGYAALAQQLFTEELRGISFWSHHAGDICGPGCSLTFLVDGRYGGTGLSRSDPVNGAAILRYVISQAIDSGASPYQAFGEVSRRGSGVDITPTWRALGGAGRSEAELEGEFLLMFYADGNVAGINRRLESATFDLPRIPLSPFPLKAFALSGRGSRSISLSNPDGVVFEIHVSANGGYLAISPSDPSLAIAIVKASKE